MRKFYYLVILLFATGQAIAAPVDAVLSYINTYNYHTVGSEVPIDITVLNAGFDPITSIDVTWSDGVNTYINPITGLNIPAQSTYFISHDIKFTVAAGTTPITVSISNINGSPDDNPSDNSAVIDISGVTFVPQKYVILEEAVSTSNGFSPSGYVEMEYMHNNYPQSFIGMSIHSGDPMTLETYEADFYSIINNIPDGIIDRTGQSISTTAFESNYNTAVNNIAPAEISFTNIDYDNNTRVLTAEVSAEFVAAFSGDYRLNLILVEDEVTGGEWNYSQANNYSNNGPLVGAGHDWATAGNPVSAANMEYDNVVRDLLGGFTGQPNSLPTNISAGEIHSYTFSTTLPVEWDEANIRLVGALQDNENSTIGRFLNGVPEELPVAANDAVLSSINTYNYHAIGNEVVIDATILNVGLDPINSMYFTWDDGVNTHTVLVTGLNIPSHSTYDISHDVKFAVTSGTTPITVSIGNINGNPDGNTTNNSGVIDITGVTFVPQKYVIIEEATGTWCGFCPPGLVQMEYMQNTYPQSFIGISVHASDPMESTNYTNDFNSIINSYPRGIIDRGSQSVTTLEYESEYNAVVGDIAPAELSFANIIYDNTTRTLTAEVSAEFVAALTGDYRLNLILVEDNVTGTDAGYSQTNNFSGAGTSYIGAGHDWQTATNPVPAADMQYDQVARDILGGFTGVANSLPTNISAGSIHSYTFSTTLPMDWNYENIRLIGALQDNENSTIGKFINAVPGEIPCSIDGIQNGDETGIDCGGSVCTPCALPPPTVTSQPTDATTLQGVTTTFNLTADNVISYQWHESTDGGFSYSSVSDNGVYTGATTPALSVTPTLAMDGNKYQCLITGDGYLLVSNTVTLYVLEYPCDAPTNTAVEMTTATNALFTWDAMPEATFYQVKYRLKGTTAWLTSGTANTQRNVPNLTAKKYYQFKVRAQCHSEWSDFSDIQLFYTSTCDVPTGVASVYLDNTRMRIRWDNDPNEIKAKVRYREVGTSTWYTQNSTPGNNYIYINNLTPNATYQYRVRSNCNGNDWSAYTSSYTHDLSSSLRLGEEESTLIATKIYPNPARDVLNIEFETQNGEEINMTIANSLGKIVQNINNSYDEGMQRESIDISQLAKGYYFMTIRSENRIETKKFLRVE